MANNEIENQPINNIEEDEIDLIALAKTVWDGRKTIIYSVIIYAILGFIIALTSPKEYTTTTTMVPQLSESSSKLGGLSSLAAMAGFNLDLNKGGSSQLSPYLYPQIVQSVPFQLELMNTPFTFSDVDHPVSLFEYYTEYSKLGFLAAVKKYTIGLPMVIIGAIVKAIKPTPPEIDYSAINDSLKNNPIYLTEDQEDIRKIIIEHVTLETNDKDGYVTLNTIAREPLLAAQVGQKAQELLQRYITEFKVGKAAAQVKFIEGRFIEKKKDFEDAQNALATFRDRNKNVTSARARTQEERLQSEYQLAFDVYSGLAQQLEQAKIQEKEETPVFAVVRPITVPLEKSKPKRAMILVIWVFLGGVFGIGWIFGKQFFVTIKNKWKEEN